MGLTPSSVSFPTLFELAVSEDGWLNKCWSGHEGGGWNPVFITPCNDWKLEDAKRLLIGLERFVVSKEGEDKVYSVVEK